MSVETLLEHRQKDIRIERRPLHMDLVEALREMILDGQFSAVGRIPERDLCDRFGVSRTPLREALKVLASDNLIRLEHNRGAHLPVLSAREVGDLFEVLAGYEALVGTLAARRISSVSVGLVGSLHERMRAHYEANEQAEYFRLNQRIHREIVASTGNPALVDLHGRCSAQIAVARYRVNYDPTRWSESMAEHGRILDALVRRDATALPELLRMHVEATAASTVAQMTAPSR